MTKTKLLLLAIIVSGCMEERNDRDSSPKGRDIGNGGDPLQILFEEQRSTLLQKVDDMIKYGHGIKENPEAVTWLEKNLSDYRNDIEASAHDWSDKKLSTCAYTKRERNAVIQFSYQDCKGRTLSKEDAFKLLAHESVHHFGVDDEIFPTKVAQLLFDAVPEKPEFKVYTITSFFLGEGQEVLFATTAAESLSMPRSAKLAEQLNAVLSVLEKCSDVKINAADLVAIDDNKFSFAGASALMCKD
jgi:hypothetical protein